MLHMSSNCAYLQLIEIVKGQLLLFDFDTICYHNVLVVINSLTHLLSRL